MDDIFRKIVRPIDATGLRGVLSRGKPIYGLGKTSPKTKDVRLVPNKKTIDYASLIRKRYANGYRNR